MKINNYFIKSYYLRFMLVFLGLFFTSSIYATNATYKNYPFAMVDYSSAYNDYGGVF